MIPPKSSESHPSTKIHFEVRLNEFVFDSATLSPTVMIQWNMGPCGWKVKRMKIHSLKLTCSPLKMDAFQVRNLQTSRGPPIFRGENLSFREGKPFFSHWTIILGRTKISHLWLGSALEIFGFFLAKNLAQQKKLDEVLLVTFFFLVVAHWLDLSWYIIELSYSYWLYSLKPL